MSIEVYIPTKLESEIKKYTEAKGNYNVDYRDVKGNNTNYYLDTPYIPLDKNTITFKSFPLKVGDNHVSGDIKNFRSITRDYVFKNTSSSDVCFNISSVGSDVYSALYYNSVISFYPVRSLIHTFLMSSDVPSGVELKPLSLNLASSSLLGFSTTKQVGQLALETSELKTTVDIVNKKIIVQQPITRQVARRLPQQYSETDGLVVPTEYIDSSLRNLRCFVANNNSTLKTKLKFITTINNSTSNILNSLYVNYTLFSDANKTSNSDGYSLLMKPQESVLFSEELYAPLDIQSTEVIFGIDKLLYRSFYSGLSPTYSQIVSIQIPNSVPIVNKEIPSEEEGTIIVQVPATYTVFVNTTKYELNTVSNTTDLFRELRNKLDTEGIKVHLLSDNSFVFINTSKEDIKKTIRLFYKNSTYTTQLNKSILTNTITNTAILNQSYFLPTNYSLSSDPDIFDSSDLYNDYDYYDCNTFALDFSDKIGDSLSNSIIFNIDKTLLKNNSKGVLILNNNTINLYKDLTTTSDDKVLQVYCDYLNTMQTAGKFTTTDNSIIFTNSGVNTVSCSLQQTAFNLDKSYQYLVSYLDNSFIFDLKGS